MFAGFGASALADRIVASGSRFLFATDITYRRGKDVPLAPLVNDALNTGGGGIERVVWLERRPARATADFTWDEFLAYGEGHDTRWVALEANEPAFILATSGTTAKPKLAIHRHGGYQVHIFSMGRWCFGMKPTDVWWATSDIGWIVGHSYMVYAPLLIGCTTVVFEGALDHPQADANWRAAVEEFGVTGIFTSPTAVRTLMRYGDEPLARNRSLAGRTDLLRRRSAERARLGLAAEHDPRRAHAGDRSHVADRDERPGVRQSRTGWGCCRSSRARRPSRCPASRPRSSTWMAPPARPTKRASWCSSGPSRV